MQNFEARCFYELRNSAFYIMAANEQVRHRPGTLKQDNKSHKTGRHRSKGQITKESKGKDPLDVFYSLFPRICAKTGMFTFTKKTRVGSMLPFA